MYDRFKLSLILIVPLTLNSFHVGPLHSSYFHGSYQRVWLVLGRLSCLQFYTDIFRREGSFLCSLSSKGVRSNRSLRPLSGNKMSYVRLFAFHCTTDRETTFLSEKVLSGNRMNSGSRGAN